MVKNHMGRKPAKPKAQVLRKLRHRRRLAAMQRNAESQAEVQVPEAFVKVEVPKVQEKPVEPVKNVPVVVSQPAEVVKKAVVVQIVKEKCSMVETIQEKAVVKVIREEREESTEVRRSLSASDVKPVQPEVKVTSSVPANVGAEKVEAEPVKPKDDHERPQKTDEETDRYLCGLFTPSVETLTENPSSNNFGTAPRRCSNCHCLLLKSETMSKLRNLFSDSDATMNNISSISESSLGLRTLFAEALPVAEADAVTTYGLRTLFNELRAVTSNTDTDSTCGFRSLFHVSEDEVTLKTTEPTNSTTSLGLRTLFEPKRSKSETSNLLNNLFGSETAVNGSSEISDKERKKALIARDLAHYLNSDDERSAPKSQSLTTFVGQIEHLFDRYRAALAAIDKLEAEVVMLKSGKN